MNTETPSVPVLIENVVHLLKGSLQQNEFN
jgi:hypothetical protein